MGKGSSRFSYLDGPSSQWEVGTLISQSSHIPKQPIPTGSQSTTFSPDLCVGFLFLVLYPVRSSVLPSSVRSSRPPPIFHTQLCHTHTPSFTHNFVTPSSTHNFVTHHLSHTTFVTPSSTHNFVTHHLSHNFVTRRLSHTILSHTVFHTQLCHTHTPSFTHNFVTHRSFTQNFVTHRLSHTTLSHTVFHTQNYHTPSFTHKFVTPSLRHFVWQAWHLVTSTFVCGRCGAYGTGLVWLLVTQSVACVSGVALGDIDVAL